MTISEHQPRRVSVRTPADLLAVIPYLVGFAPTDSLVVIALSGRRIAYVSRQDLPGETTDLPDYRTVVAQAAGIAVQHATASILVGYGPASRVTPVMDLARDCMAAVGLSVLEVLRLTDNHYFSYLCHNPQCCPPDGALLHEGTSAVQAAAVLAGMVALPSRADLATSIATVTGQRERQMHHALCRATQSLTRDLNHATQDQ